VFLEEIILCAKRSKAFDPEAPGEQRARRVWSRKYFFEKRLINPRGRAWVLVAELCWCREPRFAGGPYRDRRREW